jgi:asparagine synthase (glutamine-hydrolysing)
MITLNKYNWQQHHSTSYAGTIWLNGKVLTVEALDSHLSELKSFTQFAAFIEQVQGQFSLIRKIDESYWIATDPIASYPLFHRINNSAVEITDAPAGLLQGETLIPNHDATHFFLQFGSTFGTETLVDGLQGIEPGTANQLSEEGLHTVHYLKDYFSNKHKNEYSPKELKSVLDEIFSRYLKHFANCPFVVPLTAGYDSRLIVTMLKKMGIEQVYCFTWGRNNNAEVATARKVAETLGYSYRFIEYNHELITDFKEKEQFKKYIDYAGNFISMPFLQDYFAVAYLKENNLIPENAVFIPGHTGDGYAGSHLRPWFENLSKKEISNEIIDQFAITGFQHKALHKKQINGLLLRKLDDEAFSPVQFFDYWDISTRQARLVARSSCVFQFFGYEVVLPLCDQQFIRYFFQAPLAHRYNEKLYRETLVEYYFKPVHVDFNLKSNKIFKKESQLVKLLKSNAPQWMKKIYYPLDDGIFYREITGILMNEMNKDEIITPYKPNKYNSFIIQWYLKFIFG